jgi:hypothetical protein
MALSYDVFQSDGSNPIFNLSFEYIDRAHVKVKIDGVEVNEAGYTFEWLNSQSIKLSPTPPQGASIKLYRETPRDARLIDFKDGTTMQEEDLDTAINQQFFLMQEVLDASVGDAIMAAYEDTVRHYNLTLGVKADIEALKLEIEGHIATEHQLVEKARQWAENPEDAAVEEGAYSAKHWAAKAKAQTDKAIAEREAAGFPLCEASKAGNLLRLKDDASGYEFFKLAPNGPGIRNTILSGCVKDGYPAFLVGPEFLNMEHENNVKHSKIGTVSASAIYNGTYNEVKPLRNQVVWESNGWLTPNGQRAGWWQYDFTSAHVLVGMFMIPYDNQQGQCPKDWELLGWNGDGWDMIYSRTSDQGQRGYNSNAKTDGRMYWFTENTKAYKRVRLNVKDVIGDSNNRINIAAIRFYEAVIPGQHKYDVALYASNDIPFMASVACGYDEEKRPVDKPYRFTSPVNIDGNKFAEMSRNYVYLVPAEKDGSLPANLNPAKATKIAGHDAFLYVDTRQVHYGSVSDIERQNIGLLQSRHEVDYNPVPNGDFEHNMNWYGNPIDFTNVRVFTSEPHRGAPSSYHFDGGNNYIHTAKQLEGVFKNKSYHPYGQDFTMEIDFKFEGNAPESSDSYYILFDNGYNNNKGMGVHYWNRRKSFSLHWNTDQFYHIPFDASDRQWHTLAVSKKGSRLFMHVDGKCLGAFNDVPDINQYYRGWMLGRWWHKDGGRWIGCLNNFRYTVGSCLYQGEDYEVTPTFSRSLIPHKTLWYDAGEGVVKEWDAFAEKWTATPMLPLGHVETGFKEHLLTDQPRGTHHIRQTKWIVPDGYAASSSYDGNHTPESLFNFGHGGEYPYSTTTTAHTEDHYVQFTLEKPMAFERFVLCNTTWDWRAFPAKFKVFGSNQNGVWELLVDRQAPKAEDGGAAHNCPKSHGNSHHVTFYKHFQITNTKPYRTIRINLPNKGDVPFYADFDRTAFRMTMTFAGAKPEVEKITSYAIGGSFSIGPIPIDVNQNYRFEVPFGGAPFNVVGYVEEQWDFQSKRRLLGQASTHNANGYQGYGELVYIEQDAITVQTLKDYISFYTGNVWNCPSVNVASTKANLYLKAERRW